MPNALRRRERGAQRTKPTQLGVCVGFIAVTGLPARPARDSGSGLDVRGLLAFGSLGDLERNLLAFLERLETAHLDRREMREQIFAAVVRVMKP